ncbi:TPA: HEAT repeat domain-containing protein, partial [Candidatus Micrarchaeota archaeon]|nr:HEAT repeat domain-containing protein [Candidatus Micrarchaeota archaeon]
YLSSEDVPALNAALYLLRKMPEKMSENPSIKGRLERLLQHDDFEISEAAGQALAAYPKSTLNELKKLSLNKGLVRTRLAAYKAIAKHPQTTREELDAMLHHAFFGARTAAADAMTLNATVTELNLLKDHPVKEVRYAALNAIAVHPKITRKQLSELLKHPETESVDAAAMAVGERNDERSLKQLLKHGRKRANESADPQLPEKSFENELLALRRPAYASDPSLTAERLALIEKAFLETKKRYANAAIGAIVKGSTAKGYAEKGSDLDAGLVTESPEAANFFKQEIRKSGVKACNCTGIIYPGYAGESNLFSHGLFLATVTPCLNYSSKYLQTSTPAGYGKG